MSVLTVSRIKDGTLGVQFGIGCTVQKVKPEAVKFGWKAGVQRLINVDSERVKSRKRLKEILAEKYDTKSFRVLVVDIEADAVRRSKAIRSPPTKAEIVDLPSRNHPLTTAVQHVDKPRVHEEDELRDFVDPMTTAPSMILLPRIIRRECDEPPSRIPKAVEEEEEEEAAAVVSSPSPDTSGTRQEPAGDDRSSSLPLGDSRCVESTQKAPQKGVMDHISAQQQKGGFFCCR